MAASRTRRTRILRAVKGTTVHIPERWKQIEALLHESLEVRRKHVPHILRSIAAQAPVRCGSYRRRLLPHAYGRIGNRANDRCRGWAGAEKIQDSVECHLRILEPASRHDVATRN